MTDVVKRVDTASAIRHAVQSLELVGAPEPLPRTRREHRWVHDDQPTPTSIRSGTALLSSGQTCEACGGPIVTRWGRRYGYCNPVCREAAAR